MLICVYVYAVDVCMCVYVFLSIWIMSLVAQDSWLLFSSCHSCPLFYHHYGAISFSTSCFPLIFHSMFLLYQMSTCTIILHYNITCFYSSLYHCILYSVSHCYLWLKFKWVIISRSIFFLLVFTFHFLFYQ